ncbi:MAG TPA: kelch repeat-containing protein, partial [Chloroflexia bacterium]|nr:kelch repeat-containing protein [Chloroflexia bacterium]
MRRFSKAIAVLAAVAALAGAGWATGAGAMQAPTSSSPPAAQVPAGPVGYGGKIMASKPAGAWQQSGGPADTRVIAQPKLPLTLPVFGTDVNVGSGNEVTIASNPANPLNFLAGANNTARFTTTDGGQTWNVGSLPGGGDPAVAYDRSGVAYFAELGNTASCPDAARVWKSTDGGLTFGAYVTAISDPSPTDHFIDKEWLATDKTTGGPYSGRLYITASSFYAPNCNLSAYVNNRMVLAYSTDQGATWSGSITVSDASHDQDQFTNPVVASDSTLYVGYQYQNCTYNCNGVPAYQMLAKSTNGGLSFSPSITITGQPISYTGSSVSGYQYLYASSTTTGFRHNNQAIIGVSPTNPNEVYALWSDGRFESTFVYQGVTGWHGDIVFTRSTDGGNNWTTPIKVNDDNVQGKDQFFPWMTVGSDGTIHASWSDRRDTAVNGFPYREYYSQSTDGGLTWSANQAVADVGGVPSSFIGDYSGIAVNSDNTRVLPFWTDMRSGQRAYTDPGLMPAQGTPTATATTVAATATTTPCGAPSVWQAGPTRTPARELFQGAVGSDGKFYVAGGQNANGSVIYNDAARFNPGTNAWETLPVLPVPSGQVSVGSDMGKVFVAGGFVGT